MFRPDHGLNGSDKTTGNAGILQNRLHQVSGSGLALGSRDADGSESLRRVSVPVCRKNPLGATGILHSNHRHIHALRQVHLPGYDEHRCTLPCHFFRIIVAVEIRPDDAEE